MCNCNIPKFKPEPSLVFLQNNLHSLFQCLSHVSQNDRLSDTLSTVAGVEPTWGSGYKSGPADKA